MKSKIFKTLVSAACISALLVSLAACTSNKTPEQSTTTSTGVVATTTQEPKQEPAKITLVSSDNAKPFPSGNQKDIPELKYIYEKLGIELTIDLLAHAQYNDLWKMRVASGDVGDFFLAYGAGDPIVANGGVQDLTAAVEQYGPEVKKQVTDEQWSVFKYQGKIVGLPSMPLSIVNQVMYVRQDWMEKLGIAVPKTSDEFLDMLRAFRDKDPNGNGKPDEMPFSGRANNSWMQNLEGMFGPLGVNHVLVDGEITMGGLTPNTKNYISLLKTMYDEKLIDSEFLINQRAQWEQKIQAGLVGAWVHNVDLAWDWQRRLNEGCPEQNPVVTYINTPVGVGNTSGIAGSYVNPWTAGWLVSKDCKNPEAVVKLYNFLLTEEGKAFSELGVPGVTYTLEGGKYTYLKDKDTAGEWRVAVFNRGKYNPNILAAKDGEEAVARIKQAIDIAASDKPSIPADIGIIGLKNGGIYSDLRDKRYPEMISQIVTGNKPLDYFDTWAAEQKEIAKVYFDEINQAAKEQKGK